ncbi:MAG: hypothetical protein KAW89_06705 [Armatimonadetes bacterium]|nr:hypothetical protein [Armatimonadota bacterium]
MPSLVVHPAYLSLLLCLVVCPAPGQTEHDTPQPDLQTLASNGLGAGRSVLEPAPVALGDEPTITLSTSQPASQRMWAGDPAEFFKGAFTGFLGHECGHLIANTALNTNFHLKSVKFAVIPFFTIEPGRELSPREHYITASAGFNAQHIINEWILVRHPNLREEDNPFLKGLGTFNFWLSAGYAATAFAGYGPDERDTKGMADSLGWSEESIGVLILAPALLDAYRYKHPKAKWAKHASRITKLLIIGLVLEADG